MLLVKKIEFEYSAHGHAMGANITLENTGDMDLKVYLTSIVSGQGNIDVILKPREVQTVTTSLDPAIQLKSNFLVRVSGGVG